MKKKIDYGFTIIELLVVFSVMAILSTFSVVSFVEYNQTQMLSNATKDIRSILTVAKSRAQSQVKPNTNTCTNETLEGYKVNFCVQGTTCLSEGSDYELVAVCGDNNVLVDPSEGNPPNKLPAKIAYKEDTTTMKTIFFRVLNGGVDGSGRVVVSGYNSTKTVRVDRQGNIHDK